MSTPQEVPERAISYASEPVAAANLCARWIHEEIGTANDQFSTMILCAEAGTPLDQGRVRSELIELRGNTGVRIHVPGMPRLRLRYPPLGPLLHPSLSLNADGTLKECVLFPISVARIMALEDCELVICPEFRFHRDSDPYQERKSYYQLLEDPAQWERVPREAMLFAGLLESGRMPFMTTHDLVGHIAGFEKSHWDRLRPLAARTREVLQGYFAQSARPGVYSLALPFLAGLFLDRYAQPYHRQSERLREVLEAVLEAISERWTDPCERRALRRFPEASTSLINLAFESSASGVGDSARRLLRQIVHELDLNLSLT